MSHNMPHSKSVCMFIKDLNIEAYQNVSFQNILYQQQIKAASDFPCKYPQNANGITNFIVLITNI